MKLLLDACVLYPTVMREVLLSVAKEGLFIPLWSPRILEEWARAARKLGPTGEPQARAEIALIEAAFPQAAVTGFEGLEPKLYLPDPHDIHVLAAAIKASADGIVTVNRADFPKHILAEEGLERFEPDGLLYEMWCAEPQKVSAAVARVHEEAERLSGAPWELRALLKKARLPRLGKALS